MKTIGITGRVGSGKSEIARHLVRQFQLTEIDLDLLGHQALTDTTIQTKLRQQFGDSIFMDEAVSRAALGRLVFESADRLNQLNAIVHPWISATCHKIVESSHANTLIGGALIHELNLGSLCHLLICIDADDDDIRAKIGPKFDQISVHQRSRNAYLDSADVVIVNRYSKTAFKEAEQLVENWLSTNSR